MVKKLSKTRWSSRAESIKANISSFEIVVDFLNETVAKNSVFDKKTKDSAFCIKKNILNFNFIVSLFFMKNIVYKVKMLICVCEKIENNIVDVVSIVNNILESFRRIRNSDVEIDSLIESVKYFSNKLNIDAENDF